jgi:hypothetical protein
MFIKSGILRTVKASLFFLLGMLTATLPWLIYFGVSHAILEWINVYFVINLTSYPETSSIAGNLFSGLIGILRLLVRAPVFSGLMYFGLIVFIIYKKFLGHLLFKISLLSCFVFLIFSVYGGGREYIYYSFVFSPFIVFGFVVILSLFAETISEEKKSISILIIGLVALIGVFTYTIFFHHNIYLINYEKEQLVQYQYAAIINETENASLLNYGSLDLGFYTMAHIVPNVRFFQDTNINKLKNPFFIEEQSRYIKEKLVDFIVIVVPLSQCNEKLEVPYLYENYLLRERKIQVYEGVDYCYLLFIRTLKNNS